MRSWTVEREAMIDDAVNVDSLEAAAEVAAAAPFDAVDEMEAGIGLLWDIELEATLRFGSREMQLRDVLLLGPGDVVELDRHVSEPVDLVVGDRIVARGEVVVASGNFALRITEVATPQLRLESIRCLF
jgi:flagellar motor switch protein FliN